jgi:hypothetical protein
MTIRNRETTSKTSFALDFSLIGGDVMLLGMFQTFQRCYSPTECLEIPAQQQSDSSPKTWIFSNTAMRTSSLTHTLLYMRLPLTRKLVEIKNGSGHNLTIDHNHITFLWDMTPCSMVDMHKHSAGTCRIHLQGINGISSDTTIILLTHCHENLKSHLMICLSLYFLLLALHHTNT